MLILILIGINTYSLIYVNFISENDALVINIAGRQRMLSQKMSKESLIIHNENGSNSTNLINVNNSISLFDISHNGLRYGNPILRLPIPTSKKIILQWNIVNSLWAEFKPVVGKISQNITSQVIIDFIINNNVELLTQMDILVGYFEEDANQKTSISLTIIITFSIIMSILLILSSIYIKKSISNPIAEISEMAVKIASGNISTIKPKYSQRNDEIGILEQEFLNMQVKLDEMFNTLKSELKSLRKIVPICSHCKKIRDDSGFWESVEEYFKKYAEFSHGICPVCAKKYYQEYI